MNDGGSESQTAEAHSSALGSRRSDAAVSAAQTGVSPPPITVRSSGVGDALLPSSEKRGSQFEASESGLQKLRRTARFAGKAGTALKAMSALAADKGTRGSIQVDAPARRDALRAGDKTGLLSEAVAGLQRGTNSAKRGSIKGNRRVTRKRTALKLEEDEDEDPEVVKERLKAKILEEENSLRTSAEVTQLELIFSDIFHPDNDTLTQPLRVLQCDRPRPLLQYFQYSVQRIIEANRTWCLQLKVQRLVSGTLMDGVPPKEKKIRSREEILRSVQEGQNYWENIAAADRYTSMLVVPTPQACAQYTNCDRDGMDANHEVAAPPKEMSPSPPPPREYSTLRQYSTRLWPSSIRTAGGMRSCPGTKDGVKRAGEFQSYLDLLLFEQDRQSAVQHGTGVLGCSAGFLKGRPSKQPPALDAVDEDAALKSPMADDLGASSSSFRLSNRWTSPRGGSSRGSQSARSPRSSFYREKEDSRQSQGRCRGRRRGTPPHAVDPGQFESHLPPVHQSSSSPREVDREVQAAAAGRTVEHLPPIKAITSRHSMASATLSSRRSAIYKNVLQDLSGVRPSAAVTRGCRGLSEASSGLHAPLFNPLPPLVRLDGCPLRRRGQARILSEFTTDRILTEFEGDITMPADNESRPEVQYFRSCSEMSIMPSRLEFLYEDHKQEIRLPKQGLTDEHMQALGNAFTNKAPTLQVLDLSENRLLTDASLLPTMERITGLARKLQVLRLGGTQLGAGTIKVVAQAMVTNIPLEELSLQSVPVPDSMWPVLCHAIAKAGYLTHLDLSDTQCGRWQQTSCIQLSQLLRELPTLKAADLSNNYFRRQGLLALGKAVSHPRFKLQALSLDDNAWTDTEAIVEGVEHPIVSFCEQIRYNKSLQRLGLRRSQVDVMATYCLEDSILSHPQLQELRVEGNPFGEYGLRSLLRCLLQKTSPLEVISITEFRELSVKPPVLFNYGDLTEDYVESQALNLSLPYHRAVLRLILRRTEDFQQPIMTCLQKLHIDGQRVQECPFKKDSAGLWNVPTSGIVEFSLVLTIPPGTNSAHEFLLNWQTARRLQISVSKFMFLHRTWLSLGFDQERRLFIECVAKECILKLAHLRIFADEVKRTVPNLLSAVVSGLALAMPFTHRACINSALLPAHPFFKVSHTGAANHPKASVAEKERDENAELPEMRPRREVLTWLRKLMLFNTGNPNGHYELDLSNPVEYTVAERVLLVATWESRVAKSQGCLDLSETGEFNAIRNFTMNGASVLHTLDWQIPGDGYMAKDEVIKFDYVSLRRPKATDPVVSEKGFDQLNFFLKNFNGGTDMELTESSVFFSILKATHNEVLSADQLASIISFTRNPARRRDLFCVLFTRCRDFGPALLDLYEGLIGYKPGMIPELFTLDDRLLIRDRIGYVNTLDWVHIHEPPWNTLRLNMETQDARLIAGCILELSDIEPGMNMADTTWTGSRNKSSSWSPPSDWKDHLPEHGIFELTYRLEKPQNLRENARRCIASRVSWPEVAEADQDADDEAE